MRSIDKVSVTLRATLKPSQKTAPIQPPANTKNNKKYLKVTKFNSTALDKTYGIPTVALRYFHIYGSRQSLSNPYTGACAIFTSRILNNKPPYIFEDGNQTRDFIHVKDIAKANLNALEHTNADYTAVNIGTGKPISIRELAKTLIKVYGQSNLQPYTSNEYRKGDIRHCFADTRKARKLLNWKPTLNLESGLTELAGWAKTHLRNLKEALWRWTSPTLTLIRHAEQHMNKEAPRMKVVQVKVPESLSERDVKVAAAIEAFTRGSVSVGKAAEIAEIPIQEFLLEIKRRGIPAYPYTDKEAFKELKL